MNLTCNREQLLEAIQLVNKAVANRTTLPILECILLTAEKDVLTLTANDLEIGIQAAPIPATIVKTGVVALESRIFTEIIRRLAGQEITISVEDNFAATITCGASQFRIMGQNGDEFPALPQVEKTNRYTMQQLHLKNMIRQTIFSVAQDESKPVLTGEYLELKEDALQMVAVDGYRISFRKNPLSYATKETTVIVPAKALSEVHKALGQEEGTEVSLYFTDKHILFELPSGILVSRLIEGEYIKYAQSFTHDYKTKMTCQRNALVQALERAALVSRETKKSPVKMELKDNTLIITSNGDMGTAHEELITEVEGEGLTIAFNPKFLIDALRVIEEEEVTLQFTTSLSPCIIRPIAGDSFQYLILPLRLSQ